MFRLQTPPEPLDSMRCLPSLYSGPSERDRRMLDSSPSWEPLYGGITCPVDGLNGQKAASL